MKKPEPRTYNRHAIGAHGFVSRYLTATKRFPGVDIDAVHRKPKAAKK